MILQSHVTVISRDILNVMTWMFDHAANLWSPGNLKKFCLLLTKPWQDGGFRDKVQNVNDFKRFKIKTFKLPSTSSGHCLCKKLCNCLYNFFSVPPSWRCFRNRLAKVWLSMFYHSLPKACVARTWLVSLITLANVFVVFPLL